MIAQLRYSTDDVVSGHGNVLHSRSAVEIEVLFDLRLAAALRGLVDRKPNALVSVRHDFRHQCRVFGRDVFVIEMLEHAEAHDMLVEFDPGVHLAPADVADHVIDVQQPRRTRNAVGAGHFNKSGQKSASVIGAFNERMNRVAVQTNG